MLGITTGDSHPMIVWGNLSDERRPFFSGPLFSPDEEEFPMLENSDGANAREIVDLTGRAPSPEGFLSEQEMAFLDPISPETPSKKELDREKWKKMEERLKGLLVKHCKMAPAVSEQEIERAKTLSPASIEEEVEAPSSPTSIVETPREVSASGLKKAKARDEMLLGVGIATAVVLGVFALLRR